ncbi:Endoribonuclease YbeY [bacterium HR37]|nr:Endoribonuclease YbeY [bacterium HR37]
MQIDVVDTVNFFSKAQIKNLKKKINYILKRLKLPRNTEVCITFTDDHFMRELNSTYRGINRTTDVLSFPQGKLDSAIALAPQNKNIILLGDIVISIDAAKRNAMRYGVDINREIDRLITHGILHLLGYDHKKKRDAKRMKAKEDEILSSLVSRNQF